MVRCTRMALLFLLVVQAGSFAAEPVPTEPDVSTFTPGRATKFRLPCFAGLTVYPEDQNESLYNLLYLPNGYDPARRYPLIVRYQPQNGKPDLSPFNELGGDKSLILAVSWPGFPDENGEPAKWLASTRRIQAHTIHWVLSKFSVDRSRVFAGGFSAGGWSASSCGMSQVTNHLTTHFFVLGAGLRGEYKLPPFKGSPVFVSAGTDDMNHEWAKKAASTLRSAGLDVTYFEEPGVGHTMGPEMKKKLVEWFDSFDPARHAEEWLAEAKALEKRRRAREACDLYARVSVLGPLHPQGAAARERLEALEGDALKAYEDACAVLHRREYPSAAKAFRKALSRARAKRSTRLATLCTKRMAEVYRWQSCEQFAAAAQAYFTGRPYEAYLLAQDGSMRYNSAASRVPGAGYFKDVVKQLTAPATAAARSDAARARLQKKLATARLLIWSGKAKRARKELEAVAASDGDTPEKEDAARLLASLGGE